MCIGWVVETIQSLHAPPFCVNTLHAGVQGENLKMGRGIPPLQCSSNR